MNVENLETKMEMDLTQCEKTTGKVRTVANEHSKRSAGLPQKKSSHDINETADRYWLQVTQEKSMA